MSNEVNSMLLIGAVVLLMAASWLAIQISLFMPPAAWIHKPDKDGQWIAEVFLAWPICDGSTMYRERFTTAKQAAKAVRCAAMKLDILLPTKYLSEYSDGRKYWEEHEFGIFFQVRQRAQGENSSFVWATSMPGSVGFQGEHSSVRRGYTALLAKQKKQSPVLLGETRTEDKGETCEV